MLTLFLQVSKQIVFLAELKKLKTFAADPAPTLSSSSGKLESIFLDLFRVLQSTVLKRRIYQGQRFPQTWSLRGMYLWAISSCKCTSTRRSSTSFIVSALKGTTPNFSTAACSCSSASVSHRAFHSWTVVLRDALRKHKSNTCKLAGSPIRMSP